MKVIENSLGDDEYILIVKRNFTKTIEIIIYEADQESYGTSLFLSKQQVLNLIKDLNYIIEA